MGDAVLMIGADTSKLDRSLKSIGDKMGKVGKNLTMKLTAPLVAFGGLAIKTAADYSRAMAKVNAVTGATTEQFDELNDVAKELGRTTQFTASQVAEAMSFMGMAGMDTNDILASIPDTLNLAAAGALDMGSAANIVTNILAGFGMETEDLGGAVDVLAKAFTSSNTDLMMLGQSMKFAGPVAKGFGMTFEETAAIMGIFGNAGIQASLAGTSLRGAIVQLNNKAEEFGLTVFDTAGKMLPMADILEQLEEKGFTAGEMMDLFGLRAGPAMTALLESGSAALRDFTTELENSGGTAQKIAEVQMEGLHGSITRMKSAFEGLQLMIADEIAPVFEDLIEKLRGLIEWFSNLTDGQRGAIVKLIGVLAVAGPALIVMSQAIKGIQGVAWLASAALKVMARSVIATTLAVAGLLVGIGMVVWALWQLSANAGIHERNERLAKAHANAVNGLSHEYATLLEEARDAGQVLTETEEKYIAAVRARQAAQTDAAEAWRQQQVEQTEGYEEIEEAVESLGDQAAKVSAEIIGFTYSEIRVMQELQDQLNREAEARRLNALSVWETNKALTEKLRLQNLLSRQWSDAQNQARELRRLFEAGQITQAVFQTLFAQLFAVAKTTPQGYEHGGPILGPTALTSLTTGQTYAIAGERGPENVVPAGGGQRADIHVYLDGELIADRVGARLTDTIVLRQGVMP